VDSSPAPTYPPARGTTALDRSTAGAFPGDAVLQGFSPGEAALLAVLLKKGLLTTEQVRVAQVYGQEHGRDLRQSILELNLISPDLLNQLAFERLSALATTDNGEPTTMPATMPGSLSPNRTQHHRDVRKELLEKAGTVTLSELVNQILERACDCQATDIHFDPQENGLRVRYRIDGQLQDILFVEPAMAIPVISRLKVISNLNIVERRHSQDGRITIVHNKRSSARRS
jgi:type II secretory ATPase GspE/PulE/Tfp pilus assembly ATPase PilB-like protein